MITPLKLQFHVRGNQVPYMTEEWRKAICYRNSIDVGKSLQNTELTAIISYTRVIQVRKPINGISGGMPAFLAFKKLQTIIMISLSKRKKVVNCLCITFNDKVSSYPSSYYINLKEQLCTT